MKRRVPTLEDFYARDRARVLPVGHAFTLRSLREPSKRDDSWKRHDPQWAELREDWLKEHPRCQAKSRHCQGERQVHHVGPRHLYQDLRYHRGNLITLCEWHHWTLGHGSDPEWMAWVPNVRHLAEESRILGWTSQDLIDRAKRESTREWRKFEIQEIPKAGPERFTALRRTVVAVVAAALALLVSSCAHGPGVRVTLSLAPPGLAIQVGGEGLSAPIIDVGPKDEEEEGDGTKPAAEGPDDHR